MIKLVLLFHCFNLSFSKYAIKILETFFSHLQSEQYTKSRFLFLICPTKLNKLAYIQSKN